MIPVKTDILGLCILDYLPCYCRVRVGQIDTVIHFTISNKLFIEKGYYSYYYMY